MEGTTASPKTIAGGTPISAGKGRVEEHHRVRGERKAVRGRRSGKIRRVDMAANARKALVGLEARALCVAAGAVDVARLCLPECVDFPRRRGLAVL